MIIATLMTYAPPQIKRVHAFVDGQNLFHAVKRAFGYPYPNFDPRALAGLLCTLQGWQLDQTHFYTGVPDQSDNRYWSRFWASKLLHMSRQGVKTYSRPLRYRNKSIDLPDGSTHSILVGEEKGIDVRLAIDVIRSVSGNRCDVALIFSQDQDLSEVADEVRAIARQQSRWIKIACAYPVSPTYRNKRGINGTDWHRISRADYDRCLDPTDHRP